MLEMKKRLGILVETECSHKVNKGFLWEQKEATVEWQAATGAATVATNHLRISKNRKKLQHENPVVMSAWW